MLHPPPSPALRIPWTPEAERRPAQAHRGGARGLPSPSAGVASPSLVGGSVRVDQAAATPPHRPKQVPTMWIECPTQGGGTMSWRFFFRFFFPLDFSPITQTLPVMITRFEKNPCQNLQFTSRSARWFFTIDISSNGCGGVRMRGTFSSRESRQRAARDATWPNGRSGVRPLNRFIRFVNFAHMEKNMTIY